LLDHNAKNARGFLIGFRIVRYGRKQFIRAGKACGTGAVGAGKVHCCQNLANSVHL
jgi:hypothetical protein